MKKNLLKDELDQIAQRGISGDLNLWPEISARLDRRSSMTRFRLRPLAAIWIAVMGLLVLSGTVYALGRTLGYLPGAGLVDNTSGLRVLAEPVAVTREGVTLTISHVMVYGDRVELAYDVKGLAPDTSSAGDPSNTCGGVAPGEPPSHEGDARLQLQDGTVLERDASGQYPQNAYAMRPVYAASVPEDVTGMTFLLDCIPHARRGAAPENWAVPFTLKTVPAGTVVGLPVIEVEPTLAPSVQSVPRTAEVEGEVGILSAPGTASVEGPAVTLNLTRIVPLETRTIFYFSLNVADPDPSLVSVMPVSVYVLDSQGQKLPLVGGFAWQPFEHRVGSEFEFASQARPADGPLTLMVENAVAYYAPAYVDPPQAAPEDLTFSFDAGPDPQYGQTWSLDESFEIAGYPIRVTSARAASFDDIRTDRFVDGSQGYDYGYDFAIEGDPGVKMLVDLDIQPGSANCWLSNQDTNVPSSASIQAVQLCRDGYPSGEVQVTIRELSVLVEETWLATWTP